ARHRTRPAHERESRIQQIRDQPQERLCLRRLPPGPEPGRLGLQRGPRRGARMRSLFDGENGFAVKAQVRPAPLHSHTHAANTPVCRVNFFGLLTSKSRLRPLFPAPPATFWWISLTNK